MAKIPITIHYNYTDS